MMAYNDHPSPTQGPRGGGGDDGGTPILGQYWQLLKTTFSTCAARGGRGLASLNMLGFYDHRPLQYCMKLSQLGLSTAYMERKDKYLFIRKLMSLSFLPQEHTLPAFTD